MPLNDINQMFSITDPETGKPTDYLMRLLRNRGAGLSTVEEQVVVLEADVVILGEEVATKADKAIVLTAGTGIDGGGDLSADRTFDLANTAVTPGVYTSTNLTVDAQGRITEAASGSGGGVAVEEEGVGVVAAATILNFTGSVTVTDLGSGEAQIDITGGGGGGGGGSLWELVESWVHSVDGNTSQVVADLTGFSDAVVIIEDVTMTGSSGWRGIRLSDDAGLTYDSGNVYSVISGSGTYSQTDTALFTHGSANNGSRSSVVWLNGLNLAAPTPFISPRDNLTGIYRRDRVVNGLEVYPITATSFTGGAVYILGKRASTGGGIGVAQPIQPDSTSYSGSAFAAKGNIITARRDIVINTVSTRFGTTANYRLIIAIVNGSNVIQSIPYTGPSVSRTGTEVAFELLTTALSVASGTRIALMWVVQGGTPTTPATNAFPGTTGRDGFGWAWNENVRWASNNPAVGQTVLGTGSGSAADMTLLYSV